MTVRLCIDAGPTENSHRTRGIGWFTRNLVDAMTRSRAAALGIDASYLRTTPFTDAEPGVLPAWARRSSSARWTGIDDRLSMRWANWYQLAEAELGLPRDVRRARADVFLATDPNAVPPSRGFRTVGILYDVIPLVFPQSLGGRWGFARRFAYEHRLDRLRSAHQLIAISEATRRDAVERAGFDAGRITVAYPGVNRAVFAPTDRETARTAMRRRFGLDKPFFLYIGEADERKNLRGLADAVLRVAERHDVLLAVAGVVRGHTVAVRSSIAERDTGGRVRWLGYVSVSELATLLNASVALAFPSRYEGFGLPVVEAMSAGAPVVTSPVSSLPEVAGDAALYADPESSDEIAAALERVLVDPALAERMRERGLERAAQFSWASMADRILEVCKRVGEAR